MPRGRRDNEVRVTMDDYDVVYPRTIDEDLIPCGVIPGDVDDMGDAAAALFGSSAASINLDAETAATSDATDFNDHDSLTSTSVNCKLYVVLVVFVIM